MERHDLDATPLVVGLLAIAAGVGFLLHATDTFTVNARVALPLVLVIVGVIGLVAARPRRRPDHRDVG